MTPEALAKVSFLDVVQDGDGAWKNQQATVKELLALFDESDYWSTEFLDHATEIAKKDHIRRKIKTLKDDNGVSVYASVEVQTESGEKERRYKQEVLFDVEDYRQVAAYHGERANYHRGMERGYAKRCKARFDVQLRLTFDDRGGDPRKPR